MRETLDGQRHQLGNSHLDTLISINNLAWLLQAQGKLDEADLMGGGINWAALTLTLWHQAPISLDCSLIKEKEKKEGER